MKNIPSHQRGAAALGVTLLLLFVLALVAGFTSRNLVFEQRSSANQLRAAQAFEAAEAGLEWAQALLNSNDAIGADCKPGTAPGDASFRDRFLAYNATDQRFHPRTWNAAGTAVALQAACVLTDSGWSCSCPSGGHPALDAPPVTGAHPAFTLRLADGPRSGTVQLVATGCDHFAPACLPGSPGAADGGATARAQVLVALLPALATVPVAALTALGDVTAGGALALGNPVAGGLTAQAGGSIAMPLAELNTPRPTAASIAAHDGQLTGADTERLLTRLLGLDRARWQLLAGVRSLDCAADCSADLLHAIGADAAYPLVWIHGDLVLEGPLTLGTPERPLLLVVEGQLRSGGGVTVHGAVVTLTASWDTSGTSATQIDGALVALGHVVGNGTPTITHNAAVLARLHSQFGSFARVPGSWRDF